MAHEDLLKRLQAVTQINSREENLAACDLMRESLNVACKMGEDYELLSADTERVIALVEQWEWDNSYYAQFRV